MLPWARAALAAAILDATPGDEAACELSRIALDALNRPNVASEGRALIRAVFVRSLGADAPEAVRVAQQGKEELIALAAKISDPAVRESFLTRVPEHAELNRQ